MFQKDKEVKAKTGQSGDKGKNKRSFSGHQQQHQGPYKKGPQQDQTAHQQRKFQGSCFNCHKVGHKASECRSAPAGAQQGRGPNHQQQRQHGRGQSQQPRLETPPAT